MWFNMDIALLFTFLALLASCGAQLTTTQKPRSSNTPTSKPPTPSQTSTTPLQTPPAYKLTPEQTSAINGVAGGPDGAGGGPGAFLYFSQFNQFLSSYAATQTIITTTPWASDAEARFETDIRLGALDFISTQTAITGLSRESIVNDAIKDMGMPVSRSEAVRCGGVGLVGAVVVAVVFSGLATVM